MTFVEALPLFMFLALGTLLFTGFPVAFILGGIGLGFAFLAQELGAFNMARLAILPNRIFGIVSNETLLAVPLFVFMGVMLERSRLAERLLTTMAALFGGLRGGLALSVLAVGAVLAASTGIVGATVVTMGLISLPTMLRLGYDARLASGVIAASGTLGQIIPPSLALVLLGDVLSNAYQQAQLKQGVYSPETVSVGDLFVGALVPGLLVLCYALYVIWIAWRNPQRAPALPAAERPSIAPKALVSVLLPPLLLIMAVLGSILAGIATPTEAAAVGAVGASVLAAASGQLDLKRLRETLDSTVKVSSMVYLILIGAALFSLVFRGFGGDTRVAELLHNLPGGLLGALILVNLCMFLLGFVIDFIEITFVVVPIVAPALLMLGVDPVWLGVLFAINLQTSFLTPPFGFALFYLRGVAPPELRTADLYRGAVPFVVIQLLMLTALVVFPQLVWVP